MLRMHFDAERHFLRISSPAFTRTRKRGPAVRVVAVRRVPHATLPLIAPRRWTQFDRVRSSDGVHGEAIGPASLVQGPELAVDDGDLAGVLDPDLPVGRLGDAAEAAPVDDVPLVDARRAGALDLLEPGRRTRPASRRSRGRSPWCCRRRARRPVSLGILPVDLLAARLDDVQVEVDVACPRSG